MIRAADAGGSGLVTYIHRMSCCDLAAIEANAAALHRIAELAIAELGDNPEARYLAIREAYSFGGLQRIILSLRASEHLSNLARKSGAVSVPLVVAFLYGELLDVAALLVEKVSPQLSGELDNAG